MDVLKKLSSIQIPCRGKMCELLTLVLLMALISLPQTNSLKKCPIECTCDMEASGRYIAICDRGISNLNPQHSQFIAKENIRQGI